MSLPVVPQRPARSINQSAPSVSLDAPQIPPRPARHMERSRSPSREAYTRSPLNELPSSPGRTLYHNRTGSSGSGIRRPPSVASLPMIGQEGNEYESTYASLNQQADAIANLQNDNSSPNLTSMIAGDLPLHAPKASVAPKMARSKIATVTRTDSSQAFVLGLGKPRSEHDEPDRTMRPPSAKPLTSQNSGSLDLTRSSSQTESSHVAEEQGIPAIGFRVPMYPNAGDVQAPSPAPHAAIHTPGIGFFNDGSRAPTHEGRRRSSMGFHGPPGSYGLHGHGLGPQDQFEKSWYQRHPEELTKDGAYGPGMGDRGQWAMSSEELNKLVRESSSRGVGTHAGMIGTPTEAVGYMASAEYSSRMNSPRVGSLHLAKSRTHSQTHAESPLRKASFPVNVDDSSAIDNELDDDTIHLDPPSQMGGKYVGGGYDPPTEDLGPRGGNTEQLGGWIHERGSGTPILASDELAKDPAAEYLHPAVSPEQEKRGDEYYSGMDSEAPPPYQSGYKTRSRSRPTSTHGTSGLARFVPHDTHEAVHTPLENVEEYEPLFKDDEDNQKQRPLTVADRLKRPELDRRRFPSQDIWEDTPTSLQYTTEVSGPQEPEELKSPVEGKPSAAVFELPEKELARKGEVLESERQSFLDDPDKGFAKPKFRPGVQDEMVSRPGSRSRFPSQDIWEDTPDSLRLETTVDPADAEMISPAGGEVPAYNSLSQGMEAADRSLGAPFAKPTVPARPARSQASEVSPVEAQPSIPPRPLQRVHQVPPAEPPIPILPSKTSDPSPTERKAPGLPARPKPQVPPRPAKPALDDSDKANATKTLSAENNGSGDIDSPPSDRSVMPPQVPKEKPTVPTRPGGSSKFASIKAGFMNDLNSRLQLGPQAPPKSQPAQAMEKDEDKAPLSDARKGRARGPVRRKPAEASEGADILTPASASGWSLSKPVHAWSIDPSAPHAVTVGEPQAFTTPSAASIDEHPTASPLARNTAGEALQPPSDAPGTASGALAHVASPAMDARARADEAADKERLAPYVAQTIGHPGDVPEPVTSEAQPVMGGSTMEGESASREQPGYEAESVPLGAEAPAQPLLSDVQVEPKAVDAAMQTGQVEVGDASERLTAFIGGHPLKDGDEGTVVVPEA